MWNLFVGAFMNPELDVWLKVGGIAGAILVAWVGLKVKSEIQTVLLKLEKTDGMLNGHLEMCNLREKNIAERFERVEKSIARGQHPSRGY